MTGIKWYFCLNMKWNLCREQHNVFGINSDKLLECVNISRTHAREWVLPIPHGGGHIFHCFHRSLFFYNNHFHFATLIVKSNWSRWPTTKKDQNKLATLLQSEHLNPKSFEIQFKIQQKNIMKRKSSLWLVFCR